jgi:Cu-Zn family superoxide dismutase
MNAIAEIFSCKDHTHLGQVKFYTRPHGLIIKFKLHSIPFGPHAAHIHTKGTVKQDGTLPNCDELGGHWRAPGELHGDINQPGSHLGDLGNINSTITGKVNEIKFANRISTVNYIIGRYIIIHRDKDNLGIPGDPESLETGRSGPRMAYGLIKQEL